MFLEVFLLVCLLFALFYRHCTKQFNFFKIRGIPYAEPSFPFGSNNAKEMLLGERNFFVLERDLAESETFKNEKIFGYFIMGQPQFVINDEELAKKVMISDFDHFTDLRPQGYKGHTRENRLSNSMFINMTGQEWKQTRTIFAPCFTGSKLKLMTPHLVKVGAQMSSYVGEHTGEEFEARELFGKYALDGLTTAGFGIELNSFRDPDSIVRKMTLTMLGAPGYGSSWDVPRVILLSIAPKLAKLFQVPLFPEKATLFIADMIEKTMKSRKDSGFRRNDMIDVAMDELKGEMAAKITDEEKSFLLVANLLLMFFAGQDTISITMATVIHQLIFHQEVQENIFQEIMEVFPEECDELTWDKVHECEYMDRAIQEAMRYSNAFDSTERTCTKDYKVPGTEIIIPKGRIVKLYLAGMMEKGKNFKNPKEFDPDNFLPENKPNKFAFQAFGQGPRACVGYRYAMVSLKIALISLLRHHRVVPSQKSKKGRLELDPNQLFAIKGGTWFKTEKRE